MRGCPRGGSYSIYKHICPGGAGDLISGGCVSAPSANECELMPVRGGSSPWGDTCTIYTLSGATLLESGGVRHPAVGCLTGLVRATAATSASPTRRPAVANAQATLI